MDSDPADWRPGLRHLDAEPRKITYDPRAGRFCIIDFELAEILPMPAA